MFLVVVVVVVVVVVFVVVVVVVIVVVVVVVVAVPTQFRAAFLWTTKNRQALFLYICGILEAIRL